MPEQKSQALQLERGATVTVMGASPSAERGWWRQRWLQRTRAQVHREGRGRIGYVHLAKMNEGFFRATVDRLLGTEGDREAMLLDIRGNTGGWLHEPLMRLLSGRDYLLFTPRGKSPGRFGAEPSARWTRPIAVLIDERCYSDAHLFAFAFRESKRGLLVGAPFAGTGTAVWWDRLLDPRLTLGIPQIGFMSPGGRYLENWSFEPDLFVAHDPRTMATPRDPQVAAAVELLLRQLPPRDEHHEGAE